MVRAIAFLFLVYTAMDIASPDLCRGETLGNGGQELIAVGAPRLIDKLSSTVPHIEASVSQSTNESSQEPAGDDDCCFCCCSHVLPGTVIANVAVTDLRSSVTSLQYPLVSSPPIVPQFHPPRYA